jgi:hypothetical protein
LPSHAITPLSALHSQSVSRASVVMASTRLDCTGGVNRLRHEAAVHHASDPWRGHPHATVASVWSAVVCDTL